VGECLQRIDNALASMEKLERYRGHFYNWYDTRTLQPLHPQYVSSVDSGNLAGSLLTLQAGLTELKSTSRCCQRNALQGLQDTLTVLAEQLPSGTAPELAKKIALLQDSLHGRLLLQDGPPQTLEAAVPRAGKSSASAARWPNRCRPKPVSRTNCITGRAHSTGRCVRCATSWPRWYPATVAGQHRCRPGWNWPAHGTPPHRRSSTASMR
jgi:hypothetical protein